MMIRMGVAALMLLQVLALAGCTSIDSRHSLIQKGSGNYAAVYFIRPDTERYMGATDNRITIELNREELLKLVKSEYTLVHLKPGEVDLTIKSLTIAGPFRQFKDMERTKRFDFRAGATYYISIEPVDGEFRGTYFQPHLVGLAAAKEMSRFLRATGPARQAPLHPSGENPRVPFLPFI